MRCAVIRSSALARLGTWLPGALLGDDTTRVRVLHEDTVYALTSEAWERYLAAQEAGSPVTPADYGRRLFSIDATTSGLDAAACARQLDRIEAEYHARLAAVGATQVRGAVPGRRFRTAPHGGVPA